MIDASRWLRASTVALLVFGPAMAATADEPRPPAAAKSALPQAGSNAGPSTKAGDSANPFKPHSLAMLRQSNRLKASGYGGYVWNDGQIVLALNASMATLNKTDRDYQGHRGQAIREIDAALHQIKSKAGKAGAAIATPVRGTAKGAKPTVTAENSEATLREAHQELVDIENHMANGGNAKRLAPARALVQKAIREIDSALAIR